MNLYETLISMICIGQLLHALLSLLIFEQSMSHHTWEKIQTFSSTLLLMKQWQEMAEDLKLFCHSLPVEIKLNSVELFKFPVFQMTSSRIKFYSPSEAPLWLDGKRLSKLKLEQCEEGKRIIVVTKKKANLLKIDECIGKYMVISDDLLNLFSKPSIVIPVHMQEYKWVKSNGSYQVLLKRNGVFQVFASGFNFLSVALSKPCDLSFRIQLNSLPKLFWHQSLC